MLITDNYSKRIVEVRFEAEEPRISEGAHLRMPQVSDAALLRTANEEALLIAEQSIPGQGMLELLSRKNWTSQWQLRRANTIFDDVAADPSNARVYAVARGSPPELFSIEVRNRPQLQYLLELGARESGYEYSGAIALLRDSQLVFAGPNSEYLYRVGCTRRRLKKIELHEGNRVKRIEKPRAIAVNQSTGRLYIADGKHLRVIQIHEDGAEIADLVPSRLFESLSALAFDSSGETLGCR